MSINEEKTIVRVESCPPALEMVVEDEVHQTAHSDGDQNDDGNREALPQKLSGLCRVLRKYEFPLLIVASIGLARAYPPLGADYLQPQITATWIAVMIIFILSGLGLKTEEFSKAFQQVYFNAYVQFFNFAVVSIVVFAVSRVLVSAHILETALADGMVICSCLPMAINVVIVLTGSIGGDEAAAVFNSTFGNMVGIFLSPVLILLYLGTTSNVSLGQVFYKLALRVVLPLIIGQLIQKYSQTVREIFVKHKRRFKKVQEWALIFIVYTVFCQTFQANNGSSLSEVFLMILFQFLLMVLLAILAWYSLRFLFKDEPELRVMGFLGCVMKTVALGIPLINSMYEGSVNQGKYALPILIWHPMQLVLGSLLVSRLSLFVKEERERIKSRNSEMTIADVEAQDDEGHDDNDEIESADDEEHDHNKACNRETVERDGNVK